GFQRVGDQIWAAADQRPRGCLLGATSGRTTLGGEGLQHQDGSSHLHAATIPNCKAYDPAFAGEMAVIVDQGIRDMMIEQRDVFYYVTLMNENYAQPSLPEGVNENILKGCYLFNTYSGKNAQASITLMGSGAILTEVIKAAELLAAQQFEVTVYSVTSWSELARDGAACEQARLQNERNPGTPFLYQQLAKSKGPIIAATDYVRVLPESVRAYIPSNRRYMTLGTDGFGRSDTRAALRAFFGVDAHTIVRAALLALK
ncbi:MAG: pyruvate dehydrogenase (acetyl-transferring), homodimeric type, partial [Sheuella sp.]|nr:pyruvate dehydrogenase (acetyl-transferring), homodimeric type [Sheuella sp.]